MLSLLSSLFGRSKPSTNGHAPADDPFERRVFEVGRDFLADARSHKAGLLSRRFWNDHLVDFMSRNYRRGARVTSPRPVSRASRSAPAASRRQPASRG